MKQHFRTEKLGKIDRSKSISFLFNKKKYYGYRGDTLASALLANGVYLVSRSFKYHRPRGIYGSGVDDPNGKVQLLKDGYSEPNVNLNEVELTEGIEIQSQNCWPSVKFDLSEINNLLHRFFPAGFYYKTFMWPKSFWYYLYEPFIRRQAGFGKLPLKSDPSRYEHQYEHCDVLVVGSGPSGLSSALAAARRGSKVIIAEDKPRLGGSLLMDDVTIGNQSGDQWVDQVVKELKSMDNVTVKERSQVFGYYDQNMLVMVERCKDHLEKANEFIPRQRLWYIRAGKVVIASGSLERPLVFSNNDRPGIILASAAKEYFHVYGVLCGRKPIIFTNNDSVYEIAISYKQYGISPIILDTRDDLNSSIVNQAIESGIEVFKGSGIANTYGHLRVKAALIGELDKENNCYKNLRKVSCDSIFISGNWTPTVHLASHAGNKLKFNDKIDSFVPDQSRQGEIVVGAANGSFALKEALKEGLDAGYIASENTKINDNKVEIPLSDESNMDKHDQYWCTPLPDGKYFKRFVDLQNDVAVSDIELAVREGFRSIEHVKRYTTLGMATDQGKTSNLNGLQLVSDIEQKIVPEVGHTTFRPPYTAITIGAIVGREVGKNYRPTRKSPMHLWHEKNCAVFVDAGQWKRPRYYKRGDESLHEAYIREARNVRKNVGICDVSSLGKIKIIGKDSREFLNRIYTNSWLKLPVGKSRYGLMLREDGIVFDDGTTTRIDENHYHMTTTTAQAANVLTHLEYYLQVVWPDLDVHVTSVTEQWAGMSLAGPNSRELLKELFQEQDFSNDAFPFMGFKEFKFKSIPIRIFRISFSGELAFEINVPSHFGVSCWDMIINKGQSFGIQPYGTEALSSLRIEMGHVAGSEIDGRTVPQDLDVVSLLSDKKDFVGKNSLSRDAFNDENREKIVGIIPIDNKTQIPEGSFLVETLNQKYPIEKLGHVSASCWSVEHNNPFALALIKNRDDLEGKEVFAVSPLTKTEIKVKIISHHYVDADGKRARQ